MSDWFSKENIKIVKRILGWVFIVVPVSLLFYTIISLLGPNHRMLEVYLQTTGGKAWLVSVFCLALPWMVDWVTPGNTIQEILSIDNESHPLRVLSATLFLSAYVITIGYALSQIPGG